MSSIFAKLKELKAGLVDWDGSREVAKQYEDWVQLEADVRALLNTDGFKHLLELMRSDFTARLQEVISKDSELKAMKRMFVRTLGTQGAEQEVTRIINEIVDERGF